MIRRGLFPLRRAERAVAAAMSLFMLFTYMSGLLPAMRQRSAYLAFTIALVMLGEIRKKLEKGRIDLFAVFLLAAGTAACAHFFLNWRALSFRIVGPASTDIVFGALLVCAVLGAARAGLGPALPAISAIFLLYAFLGALLPGQLGAPAISVERAISHLTMETSGIFGTVLGTAAKYIFVFMLFGAFLEHSGASAFFLELADCLFGRAKGSGAKVNALASCLFGMVSGSAVSNVAAVGPVTVPMMLRNGFGPLFAGAVAAIAGTGGQLMPPVMGTAAFIMAETLSVPYSAIVRAALIPGVLYYAALWTSINFRANRLGIAASRRGRPGDWRGVLRRGHYYLLPPVFLILAISAWQWSPMKAGLWGSLLAAAVSWCSREKRMGLSRLLAALEDAAFGSLPVGIACASAGIIIGVLSLSGLGLKFSGMLVDFSGGSLGVLLVCAMISGLALGMGMTTTTVYIVLGVMIAPALTRFGIEPIAAHLFVFYFGLLSSITPPVATAVFAAAGIVGERPMRLGAATAAAAAPMYLLPFLFLFNRELLMEGSAAMIAAKLALAFFSLAAICAAVEGFFRAPLPVWQRAVLAAGSLCMAQPGMAVSAAAVAACALVFLRNRRIAGACPPGATDGGA